MKYLYCTEVLIYNSKNNCFKSLCKSIFNINDIEVETTMNQEFQCIKIKDGLYIGNIVVAHDYQFILCNKFGFVVNCTSEIPNVFQHENIRYLKFKLIQNKPHKLWDQALKKINKLQKFIEQAEDASLCCLIHSFHGHNRSLVFITGYLMKKYQWRLSKCLQFLKSKQIFIGLSDHYISQLQILEDILTKNSILSTAWTPPYINSDQQIISKTYLNSLQGNFNKKRQNQKINKKQQPLDKKNKSDKRVVWLDKLEKKKRQIQASMKKQKQIAKIKHKTSTHIETKKSKLTQDFTDHPLIPEDLQQNSTRHLNSQHSRKKEGLKKAKQKTGFQQVGQQVLNAQKTKNIYQLTINNFINPNFKIINKTQPLLKKSRKQDKQDKSISQKLGDLDKKSVKQKTKLKQRQDTKGQKQELNRQMKFIDKNASQKIIRAQSEKQVITIKELKQAKQKKNIKQSRQRKQKKSALEHKQRDVKKQLKKEIQKVEKEKSSHSLTGLHLVYPFNNLAQQLVRNQQGNFDKKTKLQKPTLNPAENMHRASSNLVTVKRTLTPKKNRKAEEKQ